MKKLLVAGSALAFAGSAFAGVNISGYTLTSYDSTSGNTNAWENNTNVYTETELYISGSKTSRSGTTFGSGMTIDSYGENTVGSNDEGTISGHLFVAGGFGKVKAGNADMATALRAKAITYVRNAFDRGQVENGVYATAGSATTSSVRVESKGGVLYTSPSFSGLTFAYSNTFNTDNNGGTVKRVAENSVAINYNPTINGVGINFGWGKINNFGGTVVDTATNKPTVSLISVAVDYNGFTGSFSTAKNSVTGLDVSDKRIGFGYENNGVAITYVTKKNGDLESTSAFDESNSKDKSISVSYKVAEGFSVGFTQTTTPSANTANAVNVKTTYIGTVINF